MDQSAVSFLFYLFGGLGWVPGHFIVVDLNRDEEFRSFHGYVLMCADE